MSKPSTANEVLNMATNVRDCAWPADVKEYMVLIAPMLRELAARITADEGSGSLAERGREMEDLLRSVRAVCQRKGEGTAWQRLDERIGSFGIGSATPKTFRVLRSDVDSADYLRQVNSDTPLIQFRKPRSVQEVKLLLEFTLAQMERLNASLKELYEVEPVAQVDPGWPAPFEVVQSWALANGYSGATDEEVCKAYREAHPTQPAVMFETPEALATWLDSLHECDAGGTISNRKFEAAQIAAKAIRLQFSRKD